MNNFQEPVIQNNFIKAELPPLNFSLVGTATRIEAEMANENHFLKPINKTIRNSSNNNWNSQTNIFDYILEDLKQSSPPKQAAIGGISGWLLGWFLRKIGRTTLLAVGGGFVIITVAQQQGLAEIDWPGIQERLISMRDNFQHEYLNNSPQMQKIRDVIQKYTYFSVSFLSGFLLGVVM